MRHSTPAGPWVVYLRTTTVKQKPVVSRALCGQAEWDALRAAEPGVHTLVRGSIASEVEAEKLARGVAGDDFRSRKKA